MYRQGYASTAEPDDNYLLPFGKANIIEEGDVLTLICWGAMVQKSIDAIKASNLENGEVELIDLRTLNPIDWDTIYRSVEKTGKLLIVHEDLLTGGVGAEIAAKVSDNLFEAPIIFVGLTALSLEISTMFETCLIIEAFVIAKVLKTLFLMPSQIFSSTKGTCL